MKETKPFKDSDLTIIKQLLESGVVRVTGYNNPRTFYVRFRTVLKEREIGKYIRSSIQEDGVWFWLYPKFPSLNLTEDMRQTAPEVKFDSAYVCPESYDRVMERIKLATGLIDRPEWVNKITALQLPQALETILTARIQQPEFEEWVGELNLPLDVKQRLCEISKEVVIC